MDYFESTRLARIERKLDAVLELLKFDTRLELRIGELTMSAVDDLTTAVQNEITVETSAVTLIQGLAAQLLEAKNDPAAIETLAGQISASSASLAAAVAANTPTAPAPPAEPPSA